MARALDGVKVVDLSTFVAAPGTARMLSDLGAEVIKVEGPSGDPWRDTAQAVSPHPGEMPIYDLYNTGKQNICIDIKNPQGLETLYKLLETADVFITNIREKSLVKRGLDYESLKEKFPKLIYANLDGYGEKGPEANTPGFDGAAFFSRTGFMLDCSVQENPWPLYTLTGVGDSISAMAMTGSILAALYQRTRTGKGDKVHVSLYSTAIWALSSMLVRAIDRYGEKYPRRHYDETAFVNMYKCSDGEWIKMNVLQRTQYPKVNEVLGITDEELKSLGIESLDDYRAHKEELAHLIDKKVLVKTAQEWEDAFKAADLVGCKIRHFQDVLSDEQAIVNQFIEEVEIVPGVKINMPCSPLHIAGSDHKPTVPASKCGADTDAVLAAAGFSADQIAALKESGAVK